MVELRSIKSENEINCLREGYRIAELASQQVIKEIKPGMTELQMVGVAQRVVYENGAEYEGLPMYVFSEASTRHAISRSSYRKFEKGDIVQLNLSAKIDGYSAAIGYPIVLGKLEGFRRDVVFVWPGGAFLDTEAGQSRRDGLRHRQGSFTSTIRTTASRTTMCTARSTEPASLRWKPPGWRRRPTIRCSRICASRSTPLSPQTASAVRWEKGIAVTQDGCAVLSPEIGELYELNF